MELRERNNAQMRDKIPRKRKDGKRTNPRTCYSEIGLVLAQIAMRCACPSSRVLGGVSRWLANLDRAGAAGGEDLMGRYNERFQDGKWGKRYGHKYRQSDIVPQSHLYWLGRKDEFERRRLHTLNTSSTLLICHLHWSSTCAITGRRAHNAPRTDSASGDEFVPAGGRLFLQIRYGAAAAGVVHFLCHYGQSRGPMKVRIPRSGTGSELGSS
ncbi:hypothetical protein FIBSPDRAFT_891519 [Athelia psychrophila]|uniref:Uncharacterized protein n=1 Tax=Athelia psychrophila TaxID=1759441 RepID=A0A166JJ62_9AGAM|nr:hypothetical protein FIBSPDRAFT_891519 [Fibularhizoctonia sp. CBS 109695]